MNCADSILHPIVNRFFPRSHIRSFSVALDVLSDEEFMSSIAPYSDDKSGLEVLVLQTDGKIGESKCTSLLSRTVTQLKEIVRPIYKALPDRLLCRQPCRLDVSKPCDWHRNEGGCQIGDALCH
jgi:hypothetical protein